VLVGTLVAVLVAALVGLTGPASATTPSCGLTWGSLDKAGAGAHAGGASMTVRAGEQTCYDRLVFDIAGTTSFDAWRVGYVAHVLTDPRGDVLPLRGGAFLEIVLQNPGYLGADNRSELVNVSGYRTFRQVSLAGDFEGVTSVGLGVRARLPYRVFTLPGIPGHANGTRVVIDVAHSW
jgi:hypothetical protein